MKFFKESDYNSLFDFVNFDLDEVEEYLCGYELNFLPVRSDYVEWGEKFPMFADSFYRFVYNNKIIPTQHYFWQQYIDDNRQALGSYPNDVITALQARAYRSYPSLVRDIHFGIMLKDRLPAERVIYNRKLDVEMGIDIMLVYRSKNYGINLYIKTNRSFEGRRKKELRHVPFSNVAYLNLEAAFNSHKVGDFYLYGTTEYDLLTKMLQS